MSVMINIGGEGEKLKFDSDPVLPGPGWTFRKNKKYGPLVGPVQITFCRIICRNRAFRYNKDVMDAVKQMQPLSAVFRDYLLNNPDLLPGEVRRRRILFFGSISAYGKILTVPALEDQKSIEVTLVSVAIGYCAVLGQGLDLYV